MRTKDFIKSVEELGFEVYVGEHHIRVLSDDKRVACVFTMHNYALNTYSPYKVNYKYKDALFELLVEYAKTPIEEREEPKKYYLRHNYLNLYSGENYLNWDKTLSFGYDLHLKDKGEDGQWQTKFTKEEMQWLESQYDVNLNEFKEEKVEE